MYKKAILKFYDRQLRFDYDYVQRKVKELSEDKNMTFFKSYGDFDSHLGYHENCIIKNKSYKNLRKKWTDKGPDKMEGVFLWMRDIDNMHQFCDFVCYCNMRQELNHRRSLPELCMEAPTSPPPENQENQEYLQERQKISFD